MSIGGPASADDPNNANTTPGDLSGRRALARNVFSSWLAHLVLMALGFIMPRLIDHQAGQVALGVWDFCWSIINYLSLLDLGVGTSVNRTVARLRADADARLLNEIIGSVVAIQVVIAAGMAATTLGLVWAIPWLFAERLGAEAAVASWVIGFLGMGLAVQTLFDGARGIITGCHRWDLYNTLNVSSQYVAAAGMGAALLFGFGLKGMAVSHFGVICMTELLRVRIARRVCPSVRMDPSVARWPHVAESLRFGMKSVVIHTPNLITAQTASVIVLGMLGPAALAVFSRPMALIRHTSVFVDKFAAVLTPTAGFLQQAASTDELRRFFLTATRFSIELTLPIVVLLSINGDWIMRVWMGQDYANGALIAVLALLSFPVVSQSTVPHVMIGLDAHGRIGGASLLITIAGVLIAIVIGNEVGWTLLTAATLILAPLTLSKGVVLPWMSCRRLGISAAQYLQFCFARPLAVGAMFALGLWLPRWAIGDDRWLGLVASLALGAAALLLAYRRHLVSKEGRAVLLRLAKKRAS